jgi:hypothetical protein
VDYALPLVILDVLVVVEVVLGLAVETVTVVAEAIVMGVAEAVRDALEAVTECVKVVALVALAVAKDGAKEVVELNPIKEGKWREIKLFL